VAILVEVRNFVDEYADLNAQETAYEVGLPEVINRAITVGGLVRGSARERTSRRRAISELVLSSVRPDGPLEPGGRLVTTDLYAHTETTEKSAISFRLGMAFAAVAASRILQTKILAHAEKRASGAGRRADLVGLDRFCRLHVVEAKCRTYGVTSKVREDAKEQALASAAALRGLGSSVATASTCITDLSSGGIRVLLEDPPVPRNPNWSGFDSPGFVYAYYAPVRELLEVHGPELSGRAEIDGFATGAWLSQDGVWMGLADVVLQHLADGAALELLGLDLPEGDATRFASVSSDGHVILLGGRALDSTTG
jgi:hypothetical protein